MKNSSESNSTNAFILLVMCGIVSAAFYAVIREYTTMFDSVGIPGNEVGLHQRSRPILLIIVLFTATFVVHLMALKAALQCPEKTFIGVIVGFGILFRVILISSIPIQEIDLYRYMWDGAVAAQGVSPYQFAPATIRDAEPMGPEDSAVETPHRRLVQLRDSQESWRTILGRIHFAEIATVYPPISQAVFAGSHFTTPRTTSRSTRIVVLKLWLIAFDLITFLAVIKLCGLVNIPRQYALLYGWCPLVLKEFANSGHLDAIAVCFSTVAVLFVVQAMQTDATNVRRTMLNFIFGAVFLALGIGAKLYPLILAPLFAVVCIQKLGLLKTLVPIVVCLTISGLCLWPMFAGRVAPPNEQPIATETDDTSTPTTLPDGKIVETSEANSESQSADDQPESGLNAFLSRWEMNDFLFAIIVENLKPERKSTVTPWYAITPNSWRGAITLPVAERFDLSNPQAAFLLARVITVGIFALLTLLFCWQVWLDHRPERFLQICFLTMAWFWLLLPTQNPWYWTWALPFLPFANRKAWVFVSPLLFLYYFRFWLLYHCGRTELMGTGYNATQFFDHVIVWGEFAPWFLLLMLWKQPLKSISEEAAAHSVSNGTSLPSSS